jgi:hypothetical protein
MSAIIVRASPAAAHVKKLGELEGLSGGGASHSFGMRMRLIISDPDTANANVNQ